VSRETVKTHVSRALAKVGVQSRHALRDLARERMQSSAEEPRAS
jgi:DNA-binding CsgD family transcriptional regulator